VRQMSHLYPRGPIGRPLSRLLAAICLMIVTANITATEIGDDGLHKQNWFTVSFKDIVEDINDARDQNKRLILLFEQRGCIYCTKLHETLLSDPEIQTYMKQHYSVVQYNLFGDEEVTDVNGDELTEKSAAEKWSVLYTPMMLFMPESVPEEARNQSAADLSVANLPGVFGKGTFLNMLTWVVEKGYEGPEHFQKYHARQLEAKAK